MKNKCTDCNGTGRYTGLTRTETCDTCGGSGEIEVKAAAVHSVANMPAANRDFAKLSAALSEFLGYAVAAQKVDEYFFNGEITVTGKVIR